ncbi:protein CURVATURE THYLAKOID 1D, chloroplastic [Gastrolobium bilobum]|uniref:protein CURVATURE THYLAKOID 1D, chloroplastic n=1 Tax=Gastrolobium bilobum TaxID=150636 RepID=UPI002AB0D776|nr:protein CURVATURE THYLAKOID 1D, chloroplastic [Gastrolobium bilobum]
MGLCTVQPITLSKFPNASPFFRKPSIPLRQTPFTTTAALLSRSIFLRDLLPRATTSEETSNGASQFFDEKRDGVIILEDVKAADKNEFNETEVTEDTKEELPADEQGLSMDLLDKLNFDTDDTGSLVLYGGGAIVAVWLTAAVIGAIDSIPLFPKLLEVVGLAYTVWFSSRYLLFKKNRDELAAKIEELKEQVLGSGDN